MKPWPALLALSLLGSLAGVNSHADDSSPLRFAAAEIDRAREAHQQAAADTTGQGTTGPKAGVPQVRLRVEDGTPQAYRLERNGDLLTIIGGDPVGAMYGGLDVAEAIRLGTWNELTPGEHRPYIEYRGLKFNIPLDLRTPSYSDNASAFQANIPEMWSRDFWRELLDEMARHRYNVLSLWSLHPFPSIVKVPEYPDVAFDDVLRAKFDRFDENFSHSGQGMFRPEMLEDAEVVKRLTIDEKIAFWREVMQMAQRPRRRCLLVHLERLSLRSRRTTRPLARPARRQHDPLLPRQRARDGQDLSAARGHRHHRGRVHGRFPRRSHQGAMALADLWRGHSRRPARDTRPAVPAHPPLPSDRPRRDPQRVAATIPASSTSVTSTPSPTCTPPRGRRSSTRC